MQEFDLQLGHDHLLQILPNSLLTIRRFLGAMQICITDNVIKPYPTNVENMVSS